MYLTFNKETKIVAYKGEKKPISYSSNLELAKYSGAVPSADFLTVDNVREETETYTEISTIEKENENGEIVLEEISEEKTRACLVCDLIANFYPEEEERGTDK